MRELQFVASHPQVLFGDAEYLQSPEGVTGRLTVGSWALGPDGGLAVGALGVFSDEVLGYALLASTPPGGWSVSTEIWLDLVGPLPGAGEVLTGHGRVSVPGAYATGEIRDAAGRVVVLCRQRGRVAAAPEDDRHLVTGPGSASAAAGIDALLGLKFDGPAYRLRAESHLINPLGTLHGGVSLAASEAVAARSRAARGCDLPTASVHMIHARAVPSGATVDFRTQTRHAGRTLWVTEVVGRVGGRTCTVATITAQPSS